MFYTKRSYETSVTFWASCCRIYIFHIGRTSHFCCKIVCWMRILHLYQFRTLLFYHRMMGRLRSPGMFYWRYLPMSQGGIPFDPFSYGKSLPKVRNPYLVHILNFEKSRPFHILNLGNVHPCHIPFNFVAIIWPIRYPFYNYKRITWLTLLYTKGSCPKR